MVHGPLGNALYGDHTQVCCTFTELFRLLVDLRLIPTLGGRKVFKLKHHQAGRLPVALKDDKLTAAGEKPAAAAATAAGDAALFCS